MLRGGGVRGLTRQRPFRVGASNTFAQRTDVAAPASSLRWRPPPHLQALKGPSQLLHHCRGIIRPSLCRINSGQLTQSENPATLPPAVKQVLHVDWLDWLLAHRL